MAFLLQLTDGTDTIDFISEDFRVEDGGLQISPPEEVQTWTDPSSAGGAQLVDHRNGNREITVSFHIAGANRTTIRQGINRINAITRAAIQHSLGLGSKRVTLKYAWDGVTEVDHFEVLSGQLTLPDDVLSVEKLHTKWGDQFKLRGCQLNLVVSPTAYGLSPSTDELIELPLTNRNGTDVTGGLSILPFTDARDIKIYDTYYIDNYVEIKGAHITGDTPGKLRIQVSSNANGHDADRFTIGAHVKNNGNLFFHWADSNVEMLTLGSQFNTTYSLGNSVWRSSTLVKQWSGGLWRIKLTTPEVYESKKYRVFMTTGYWPFFYPTKVQMQLRVESQMGVLMAEGPIVEQYASSSGHALIMDMGVVQLPPHSPKLPTPQDVYLKLYVLGGAEWDYVLTVGHIWLVPVDSGYRVLRLQNPLSNYISLYPTVVDDNWNDLAYVTNDFGEKSIAAVQAMYAPIKLTPGKDHRIYFNFAGHGYVPHNSDIWQVRVFYSPAYTGAV